MPRTHLILRKALDESASARGKKTCCNALKQYFFINQLRMIDVFVRTAIQMHPTSVKNLEILLFHMTLILLR